MEANYREQYTKRVMSGELTKEEVNAIFSAMGLELLGEDARKSSD